MVEKLLDEFNLQHLRNIQSNVLSGGEVRRLMIINLLINQVLLLDEPVAALDPIVVQDIQKYILKLQSFDVNIGYRSPSEQSFRYCRPCGVLGEQSIIAKVHK